MDILSDSRFIEVREGFLRLFDMKINGVISPLEERRRKELAIQYLKVSDIESNMEDESEEVGNQSMYVEDDNWAPLCCGKCSDGFLRRIFVFFRLIDDDV